MLSPSETETITQEYHNHLANLKYSANTTAQYSLYFNTFITQEPTQAWLETWLRKHNNAMARAFLKTFITFTQVSLTIPPIKGRAKQKELNYLTPEDINKLITSIPNPKYALLIRLLYETGLRISEALSLTPLNRTPELTLKGIGKGNKEYTVNISDETGQGLNYLAETLLADNEQYFRIGRHQAHNYIKAQAYKILNRKITPHTLRHSTAMRLKKQGLPIEDIKTYLRHEHISTTNIYAHTENKEALLKTARNLIIN